MTKASVLLSPTSWSNERCATAYIILPLCPISVTLCIRERAEHHQLKICSGVIPYVCCAFQMRPSGQFVLMYPSGFELRETIKTEDALCCHTAEIRENILESD
ncbi:hypothetical protein RB195_010149 [Necator americanus]|uniref:Uncharacterized protein n=1 Tax=Necator americanus TaxID=51031 RepID=A0ABR1CWP4_NECAM